MSIGRRTKKNIQHDLVGIEWSSLLFFEAHVSLAEAINHFLPDSENEEEDQRGKKYHPAVANSSLGTREEKNLSLGFAAATLLVQFSLKSQFAHMRHALSPEIRST